MKIHFVALLVLLMGGAQLLPASEEANVKRTAPERDGRVWVQRATCGVPVRQGARLVMRADFGSVRVKPGQSERMECQVSLRAYTSSEMEAKGYFGDYQLSVRSLEGGGALVSGRLARERHNGGKLGAEFQISVPLQFNLDLQTQDGEIEVEKLEGDLGAVTAGGDIRTGDVTGSVRVETAGGSLTLGTIGKRLEARTAGGSIHVGDVKGEATLETSGGEIVAGLIGGPLRAETAGGDIVLRGASGHVEAQTAGGQIQLGECGGSIRAQTAGGSIRLAGARGLVDVKTAGGSLDLLGLEGAVRAATAAGPILAQIGATRKTFAASLLEAAMGDVQVYLPADLPLTIDAAIDAAAGHQILSDFPLNIQGEREGLVPQTLRGYAALNGGGEALRIRTVAGNIEIRKLDLRVFEQLRQRQESFWKRWEERSVERERRQQEREQQHRDRQYE